MFQLNQKVVVAAFEDLPQMTGTVVMLEEDAIGIQLDDGEYAELYEDMFDLISGA